MKPEKNKMYKFHIVKFDGSEITWYRLTKTKAMQMYRYTDQSLPSGVKAYGWGEME